ncbi:aldehyde dehydrogenase family protein [Saccharopolyspora hattusasensis]|uniref:aldehyde dehydrogenase family protein n=1 Tax=Saccharopolyspora hattusasensis TaxID=1128679 RepID=UPI003D988595
MAEANNLAARLNVHAYPTSFRSFVDGVDWPGATGEVDLRDPATDRVWGRAVVAEDSVEAAVGSAAAAFEHSGWPELSTQERAAVLVELGGLIERNSERLAVLETLATGKPLTVTRGEVSYGVRWYRYYAAALETGRDTFVSLGPTKDAVVRAEPLGVVAAITPFNGAYSLGSWKIAPALAAGNCVVVKPPALAPGSTIELARLALEAGVPRGVLNVVVGDAREGGQLASDDRVELVTFTGSTTVAQRIGAIVSGRMGRFVCEAGGKSAHIVLDDADLSSAVVAATQGVFSGSGQTCVAGSRLLVHEKVFDEFLERFVEHTSKLVVGNPFDPATHLGPIATARQRDSIKGFIARALAAGAQRILGDEDGPSDPALRNGYWVRPTILTEVKPDMEVCREEVFGPVVAVQRISSLDEALRLANDSQYGLAAGIWTTDQRKAHRAARFLQAGTVWINTYRGMDWRTPFGGYKKSGIGRENGLEGLAEFTQTKTVVQDFASAVDPFALVAR